YIPYEASARHIIYRPSIATNRFTMQSVILRYYRVNKTFMSQIGTWPYQSRTMRILIPIAMAFIDISYVLAEMIRMFDTWGNVDIAVECIISTIIVLACFTKLLNLSFRINEIILLHDTWGDVDTAVESVINITIIAGASTKLINIVVNNGKFRRLLRLMNDHWNVFNSKSERYILKYYADIGQKVTKYYTGNE
ncbi:odorant receptor 22b, partial [Lasius niger]